MAKAKKLPSGSWRAQAYDFTDSDGKIHLTSFTADTKKEAEYLAAEYALNKKKKSKPRNMTLSEAIDEYIQTSDAVLSPTTIQGYKVIKKNSYKGLMDKPLKSLTVDMLQAAVNEEAKRPSGKNTKNPRPVSPKTVKNSYGLITAVINRYYPDLDCTVKLPTLVEHIKELPLPEVIMSVVKDTEVELPVLLAMWLSFSMSEVRGLKKSSISNGYITIKEVVVDVNRKATRKEQAKTLTRIRRHEIPEYIQSLIDRTDPDADALVTLSGNAIYRRFTRLLAKNGISHMSFHDLRHMNASVMAMLRIPEKYAMERGGWKTDKVMKKVYTHTFSDEREKVDATIDNYFKKIVSPVKTDIDLKKYHAWLTLFDKPDNSKSMTEFKKYLTRNLTQKK